MSKAPLEIPSYDALINPVFQALKELGGSGNNNEILERIIINLNLSDEVVEFPHLGSSSLTELAYRAAWARTYLKKFGAIENSARAIWSILPNFAKSDTIDAKEVVKTVKEQASPVNKDSKTRRHAQQVPDDEDVDKPDEIMAWRGKLSEILQTMDPFGFERLAQRILRECGFTNVEVTKKSGDGGIDGTGKLKINGIFSFNVAFQCKRYKGIIGAPIIRDFRGSLTTNIEKGVVITTGTFSKDARLEAASPGKQQIDLMDGEELIDKIAEYSIGVREVKTYEIDEDFFKKI